MLRRSSHIKAQKKPLLRRNLYRPAHTPVLLFAVMTLLPGLSATGDEPFQPYNPFLEEEAPPALFSIDRTDADVDIYVLGNWLATSRVATGFALHPPLVESGKRMTFPYEYPGFETELFSQTLDIVLSLWLYNRYFFEASFADDSSTNTVAAGYVAVEDELVRELVVGNVPLAVGYYPFQYTGSPGTRTGNTPRPGAVVRLETARTYHELLLQLENSRLETRRFSGSGVLQEVRIRPEDYLRQGIYVLPHAPVRQLTVYAYDPDGSVEIEAADSSTDRRTFTVLDPTRGDYVADTATGILRLGPDISREITIAVAYDPDDPSGSLVALDAEDTPTDEIVPFPLESDGGTTTYGTGEIPLDRYRMRVTAGTGTGRRGVYLTRPGLYSPFAAANHFDLPAGARAAVQDGTARIRLVRRGTRTPAETEAGFLIEPIAQGTLLRVIRREGGSADGARSAPNGRDWKYPFSPAHLYGPRSHPGANLAPVDLLVEFRTEEAGLFIDGDIVPGTVSITRNGRPVPGSDIDYTTGEISFPQGIGTAAEVDVRYRVYTPEGGTGDVVAISGNRWQISDSLLLSLATGMRWTIAEDRYSQELDEHPGQVTASMGAEYTTEDLTVNAATAIQVFQPDTTGYMRLFGGGAETLTLAPRATTLFPASAPNAFSDTDRVIPLYRDYWTSDGLGNFALQTYTDQVTADENREGARMGPYLARSTDGNLTGTIGVLEWETLAPGQWVGALLRATSPPMDLRDARRITVRYRYLGEEGTELIVQLGALEEDLDRDSRVDRGRSAIDPTFEFNLPSGRMRRAGQDAPGLAEPHREDVRRDGVLREEVPEGIVDLPNLALGSDETWQIHTFTLTAQEAARLADLRGVRFLVRNPTSATDNTAAGRLLIGSVDIERTGNATVTAGHDRNARASVGSDGATPSLRDTFDIVKERFNPDDSDQPVLDFTWDAESGTSDRAAVEFSIPDTIPDRYGRLVFFARLNGNDGNSPAAPPVEKVTLTLAPHRDASPSQTLSVKIPAALLYESTDAPWREISVNLQTGELSLAGAPDATLPRDTTAVLRHATVSVEGISRAGTLFFDELHLSEPRAGTAAAGRIGLVWQTDLGKGRLTLEQDLEAQTSGFRSSETTSSSTGSAGTVAGRSRAAYRANRFLLAGEGFYRFEEDRTGSGALGHQITLPIGGVEPVGLVVEDEFLRDFDPAAPLADRRFGFSLGTTRTGRYRFSHHHQAHQRATNLRWGTVLTPPRAGPVGVSFDAEADLRDLDRTIGMGDYGDSWLETGRFIVPPGPSGGDTRQERRLDAGADIEVYQLRTEASGGWRNRSDTAGTQESIAGVEAELPLEFAPPAARRWTLTPGYRRTYRATDRAESDTYNEDFTIWRATLGDEPMVLTTVPFVELFQSPDTLGFDDLEPPREARLYEAEARMRFSRAFTSRPRDLWVPADAETLIRRTAEWEDETSTDYRIWQISTTAVAINLFGMQGSTPIAPWYMSDEFRNRVFFALTESVPGEITRWRVEVRNDTVLLGFRENELALSAAAELTGGDLNRTDLTGKTAYVWRRAGHPPFAVFRRMEVPPFYRHSEHAEVTAAFEMGEFSGSELTIGHETALVVSENGEFRIFADAGWIVDPAEYEDGALHLIGIQAGIEGVLRY